MANNDSTLGVMMSENKVLDYNDKRPYNVGSTPVNDALLTKAILPVIR